MENVIQVTLQNGLVIEYPKGVILQEIAIQFESQFSSPIVVAKVGNELKELSFSLEEDCSVTLLDLHDKDGMRIYKRSLCFVLAKAAKRILPDCDIQVMHTIGHGLYGEVCSRTKVTPEFLSRIRHEMDEMIAQNLPFERIHMTKQQAIDFFNEQGQEDKAKVFLYKEGEEVSLYRCGSFMDYFYGYMVPSTGMLKNFSITYMEPGFIIHFPSSKQPNVVAPPRDLPQLHSVFKETKKWMSILGIENVGDLNDLIVKGEVEQSMRIAEALHEKRFASIADKILDRKKDIRVVLIAGPSSSGKTTSAARLGIQLRVNGFRPVAISLDDYFVNREDTPKDENGEYDFETIDAIDVTLFNDHMKRLLAGEEVEIPTFNFKTGQREMNGHKLKLQKNDILIIEGIHGLNEKLSANIPRKNKFKIYVSALTSLNIDAHNRISTTDARLIRRIVRDHEYRGNDARRTIQLWPNVRKGEEKNIFPFQEEADVMFNSSLLYELSVLKSFAQPLLQKITPDMEEYAEANRLLKFLNYFLPVSSEGIPDNSILREFVGGSCFH